MPIDHYHIDTDSYSLQRFKKDIASRDLIPSRAALKEDLDARFACLEKSGITNLRQLLDALRTKPRLADFSKRTGLSLEYLTLLRREANSYLPNPVRIDAFPGIPAEYVQRFSAVGIKNSRQLFNAAIESTDRERLSRTADIPKTILNETFCLSDLVRAYGIGPVFARMLYDLGIRSIGDFVRHSAQELISLYETKERKKADFGFDELHFSIDLAKNLYNADWP